MSISGEIREIRDERSERSGTVTSIPAIFLPEACPRRPLKKLIAPPHPGETVMFSGEYTRWDKRLHFP
jgi:hypothetical protein